MSASSILTPLGFSGTASPCGSEPARDSGGSAGINAECADAIASKLVPTFGLGAPWNGGRTLRWTAFQPGAAYQPAERLR
ncbi:hypothetical protein C0J56_17135 [Pseudomonas fluorescens]|nr:hypothetical protein C0J56_17135 [Pseudomonas fluorescens]